MENESSLPRLGGLLTLHIIFSIINKCTYCVTKLLTGVSSYHLMFSGNTVHLQCVSPLIEMKTRWRITHVHHLAVLCKGTEKAYYLAKNDETVEFPFGIDIRMILFSAKFTTKCD